jgi:phospholipase D1/2
VPKVKPGHVATDLPLATIKERLAKIRGHLVESPLDFLIDEKDLVTGAEWSRINLSLPVYI